MDEKKFSQLTALLDRISSEASTKAAFLSDPLRVVSASLDLAPMPSDIESNLANALVLSVLRSPKALNALKGVNAKREASQLDEISTKKEIANIILDSAPPDLQARLINLWGGKKPHLPDFDPKSALVNLIVHVDVAAVVTKAVAVHQDYVFNGSGVPDISDLQKVANSLAQGR